MSLPNKTATQTTLLGEVTSETSKQTTTVVAQHTAVVTTKTTTVTNIVTDTAGKKTVVTQTVVETVQTKQDVMPTMTNDNIITNFQPTTANLKILADLKNWYPRTKFNYNSAKWTLEVIPPATGPG